MNRSISRWSALFALALAAGTVTAVMAVPSGAATPPMQVCRTLKGSATFTPGLTNTARDNTVKAHGNMTNCTGRKAGPKTGGSGVLAATIKVVKGSCLKLATGKQTIKGTAHTTWKNKKVSYYSLTLKTGSGTANATTATITGKVTRGLFNGHSVTGQIKFAVQGSPNCTTKPVKSVTFHNTKAFIIH
jgi:hypothetical protein